MSSKTNNAFGSITISNKAVEAVACKCAMECYGIIDLVPSGFLQNANQLVCKNKIYSKGVKVSANENRLIIDVFVIMKYGVNISAVSKSLEDSIRYNVEDFTGMIVDRVNVHVMGVRV
jgi:uncharacterized alkaline shock family protein YloU